MLGVAPLVGPSAGSANVQQLADICATGDSCRRDAVVSERTRGDQALPRGHTHIGARGEWQAALTFSAMTCSSDNGTAIKRALAHNTTAKPLSNARTVSWTARSAAQRESADVEARMRAITAAMVSSPPPLLTHAWTGVPSAIACVSSSTPVTSAACTSVGTDTAASRVPRTSPSSPPVASSDDATSWSMTLHTDATHASVAEAYWVPYDVYLTLSAPLLRERALQDCVATLCCPMTPSAEGQSHLVKIDSVFSFLLHGNAMAPPIASAAAVVAPVSMIQSPMQSSSLLHWSEHGSRSDKAELIAFPLFCVLGAKLCTVSRRTRSICSIHTPAAPIAARLAMHPDQRGGCGSHSRHGSNRTDSTYRAAQQNLAAEPGSDAEAALPRRDGGRDHVLLLFAEQLINALPGFPVALLYTTSPTGAVVSAPPAETAGFWDSWHKTPRAVRRSVSYEHMWSVVTLPRLVAMLQRWGVAPAVAMRRLCVGLHCSSTSPLEPPGTPHPLHTAMDLAHGQGEEEAAAATAVPDAAGALRQLQFPLAEPNSCLVESPPPLPTAASGQLARASVVGPPQHILGSSSSDGAVWDSLPSDAGVVPHRSMSAPAMQRAGAAVRAPATSLERRGRVTADECGTCGVTTLRSQDGPLSSGEKGDAGDPVHPYNAVGAPGSVNAAPQDNRGLYGQAHLYDTPSPPPPPAASSVTATAGSVVFVRGAVSGTPLTESSTTLCNTRRFRYPGVLRPPLQLRLHTSSFLERANGPVRATKGAAMLSSHRCPGAPKRVTAVSTDMRYSHSGAFAHPYEMSASDATRQSVNRHRRRYSGRGRRLIHEGDHRRGTNVRDAPALTPTPPTRGGSGCCLGARQRTEHVKRYMQVLMSAAALWRPGPSPTAADGFPQQQQQNTAHRYGTGDHLATAAGATPLCVASSSSGTGSNTKSSLNRSRESEDGSEAMPRRAPVPPPPVQQHQLHLRPSPHANILLCHQSSISTQLSFTPSSLTGGAVSVALSDHAASVSAEHENKQLCDDGNTDRSAGADAAPSPFARDFKTPSMTASSDGSLALADAAGALPTAQVLLHPETTSLPSVTNVRTHNAARNSIGDSLSTRLTSSPLRSIFTGLRALLQLATPPSPMQERHFPHRDSKPAGPLRSACSPEDRAVRPCAYARPELSSPLLIYSSHPTLYAAADAEAVAATAAVSRRSGDYDNPGSTASPPPSDVLSPPGQHSLTLRALCERPASCLVAALSDKNLSPPLRRDRGSVVSHLAVTGASARPSALTMSGFSAVKGFTANARPLSANESGHGAESRLVAEPAISVDLQLHAAAREHAADAQAVPAPGAVRHDGAAAVAASTAAPPVSPGCQPSAASRLSRRLADVLVDSNLHEGGRWPSFLPLSLFRPTLAVATQFPGDAGGVRVAVPPPCSSEFGLLSGWIDTAALLMNLVACVMQAVGRGYVARRDLRRPFRRPSSRSTERAAVSMAIAAAAPAVTRSPHHTLVTPDPSMASSPTASASASPAPPSLHNHGVATPATTAAFSVDHFPGSHRPSASTLTSSSLVLATQPSQGCPPPPLTAFSASPTFPINATVAKASTTPSDVRVSARDVSLVATATSKSSLQRHNAASQTSSKSNKILAFSSLAATATHSSPNNLSSFSGLRPRRPTCSLDAASPKKVPASSLRHLFAMRGLQSSSTSLDSGTWAPAPSVEAAGDTAASSDGDDATAAASAGACTSVDAATLLLAISMYTVSTALDVVPQGQSSAASRGHELSSPRTHGDNNAGGEPSGGAVAPARRVAGEPLGFFPPPSLKVQSNTEYAASTAFCESAAERMGMMQEQLAVTPSCTVPFLDQAVAKGPSASTIVSSTSQGPISLDGARSSSCRLSSSADEYATPMIAESLLQLQRIGRGCLIRQQCELSYRERQERTLGLLHKRVCQHMPVLLPSATSMEEDGVADGFGGASTAGGAAAVLSGITGLRSASSSYQPSDPTRLTASLPQSTPSLPGVSRPLVTLMAGQRCLSPVNDRHFTDLAHPASLLSQVEPNLYGSEDAVGIVGDSAQLADDRSTAATLRGKTNTMAVSPNSAKCIASPAFVSPKRRSSVLFTDPPSHMLSSGSPSEPRGAAAGGAEDGTLAAGEGAQEAGATQADRGSLPSSAPLPAAVTVADTDSGDDDAAVASPLVPTLMVVLPSSSAAVSADTNDSARKAQPPAGRAPSPLRPSLLSPPSLRVSFSRDSYLPSVNSATMRTSVSAAAAVVPVTSAVGTSISATMSASSSRQASCSEGAYSMRSPYRSPPSPFIAQGSPHTDMVGAAVDSNGASCCPLPRRRFLIAVPTAELSPMEGSIVATSGRSARSLNSINSLPFNCSTTANTTSVTAQIFSTSLPEGMTPELWVLGGVEEAAMSSSLLDGSDDDDAEGDNEGDTFKADLIHVEGGAEPACFGAAAQVLGREAAPPLMSKALRLLQRVGRGYLCRRHQHFLFMVSISWAEVALIRRVALGYLTRRRTGLDDFVHREAKRQMAYWALRHRSAVLVQSVVRGFNARQRVRRLQRRVLTRMELRIALEQQNTDE